MAEHVIEIAESEILTLNRFPDEPFKDFVKLVFEFITCPKDFSKLMNDLEAFCGSIGANQSGIKNLVKSLISFLQNAAKHNYSSEIVHERLLRLGLSSEKVGVVAQCWNTHFVSLCRSIISQVFTVNQLVDMEWKFGVTAATSDVDQVGQSFLQLKLVIDKGNGQTEDVCMELSLPQFYSFLHEMEKAKANFELLS